MTFQGIVGTLGVPFDLGAARRGASLGPDMVRQAGLITRLQELHIRCEDGGLLAIPRVAAGSDVATGMKHFAEVAGMNRALAGEVSAIAAKGRFPLLIGGDHSMAIGTIAGVAAHNRRLGVIWFDAHGDLNTPDTSPSGNIHGMSLAVSLGLGHPALTGIGGNAPKVRPEHVVLIGARLLDAGEKALIRSLGIRCYTMYDIDRYGMSRVMEEAIARVSRGTDGVHLSFDVDSLDPREAPGTGTQVRGGVSYREAHLALELLHEAGIVTSAEFVEVNPALDTGNRTAQLVVDLAASLLGERIL